MGVDQIGQIFQLRQVRGLLGVCWSYLGLV